MRVGLLALLVLAWTGLEGAPLDSASALGAPSLATGMVIGLFVGCSALAALASLRRHGHRPSGLTAATGALVSAQALLVALPFALHSPRSSADLAAVVAAGVVGAVLVGGALVGLARMSYVVDELLGVGLGMGLVAAGHLLLLVPVTAPVEGVTAALLVLLASTHLLAAAAVIGTRSLARGMARLLAATAVVVSVSLGLAVAGLHGSTWSTVVSVALAAVGAAWVALAWSCAQDVLRRTAESARIAQTALSATRDQREQMHELRSTVAGLVNGSAMLDRTDIDDASRERINLSLRRELDRMQRLLSPEQEVATQIDLDEALGLMLDVQGLKGRRVELRSNGERVRARPDALAEVVNILMDNAATHGGSDSSLIEVARRDEEMVDITVTDFGRGIPAAQRESIFEWGRRGPDSPGEGIGLHLAQRLVVEDGGSLQLREADGAGSSFVISLPAPRLAPDDRLHRDGRGEDDRAWTRSG